jgi:hypothetical protein
MRPDQDAFGQMMAVSLRGAREPVIIERDDGFISVGRSPSLYLLLAFTKSAQEPLIGECRADPDRQSEKTNPPPGP